MISEYPPHEKLIEELFVAFAFLYLKDQGRTPRFYAPSQREEKLTAIDGKFTDGCLHLYLQFKAAKQPTSPKHNELGFYLSRDEAPQLGELNTKYTRGSAFYVLSAFENADEIQNVQENGIDTKDFLDSYIAIPVHPLAKQLSLKNQRVRLKRRHAWLSERYRRPLRTHQPKGIPWLHGTTLLDGLLHGQLGSRYVWNSAQGIPEKHASSPQINDTLASNFPSIVELVGEDGPQIIPINDQNAELFDRDYGRRFDPMVLSLC